MKIPGLPRLRAYVIPEINIPSDGFNSVNLLLMDETTDCVKDYSPMDLNVYEEKTGLSNRKWERAIKGLTQQKPARVEKNEEGLLVSVV